MGLACQSIVHDEDGQPKHPSPNSHRGAPSENRLLFRISRPESAGTSGGYRWRDKSSRIPANFACNDGKGTALPSHYQAGNLTSSSPKRSHQDGFRKVCFCFLTTSIVRKQPHSPLSGSKHNTRAYPINVYVASSAAIDIATPERALRIN